jgi:hypothetical protein
MWLYSREEYATRLDACVTRACEEKWDFPDGGTTNWANPTMIDREGHDLYGMYYVEEPPEDVREQVRSECPPDRVEEHSDDWHPEPEL